MNLLPFTSPAFAVKTMSGEPGWAITRRTTAWSVTRSYSARHCCFATALSMRRRLPCIHGLMMYATVKYSGGHIRNKWRGRTPLFATSEPIRQVALDVFHVLETHREPDQSLDDAGLLALGGRDAAVRGGRRVADRALHVAEIRGDRDHLHAID